MSSATVTWYGVGDPTATRCGVCHVARLIVRTVLVCRRCDNVDHWPAA